MRTTYPSWGGSTCFVSDAPISSYLHNQGDSNEPEGIRSEKAPRDLATCWEALTLDAGAGVLLINVASGRIEYANDDYARMRGLTRRGADLSGTLLEDILPPGFASECIELDRRAHREQRAIVVHTSFRGRAEIQTIRPVLEGLINPASSPTVLVTIRAAAPGADVIPTSTVMAAGPSSGDNVGDLVVRAKYQDMGAIGSLTTRELQILRLIGEGLTTAQIAARLFRSAKTIEWHRMVIGRKLGAKHRAELARIAISAGLVDSR